MTDMNSMNVVCDYIMNHWKECIRVNKEDEGSLIGLPYPYIVPCRKDAFQEMYYWDTFFTNKGLIFHGLHDLAKNNVDNMLYLVNKYGFMPNGNRTYYLNRSQPPYLSMMVRDIYEVNNDVNWLKEAYNILETEYTFWMTKRISPIGLNRYYSYASLEEKQEMYLEYLKRTGNIKLVEGKTQEEIEVYGRNVLAECESGWDFNPRFNGSCGDFIPIDLNCNIYLYEKNFAYFSEILGNKKSDDWEKRAQKRMELLNRYCWSEDEGLFMDCDYVGMKTSPVKSLASYHPLWAGIANPEQCKSAVENLKHFECDFGLSTCEKQKDPGIYQWGYPNGWAPLHYIVVKGLENNGFTDKALDIAKKYIDLTIKNFNLTNDLWEKYNVENGSISVSNEYEMPAMMGWTAGVFVCLSEIVRMYEKQ